VIGADRAFVEQRFHVTDQRVLDVIVAHDSRLAGFAGRGAHALGIGERGRHRLFAPDMLAGFEGRDRHVGMKLVGRCDRDHIDFRIGEQIAPIAVDLAKPNSDGLSCRRVRA
jgi:hypothetical protein